MTESDTESTTEGDLADFNPFDPDTLQCPFPHYAQMRTEEPVKHIPSLGMYLVTRHDQVLEVLRNPTRYSSVFGGASMPLSEEDRAKTHAVIAEGYPRVPTMLTADAPEHTRYRRLVSKAFTPRVIAELEPVIRNIANRLIDAWPTDGPIEFVEDYAVPLPVEVIAHALNVPESRMADFKRWSDDSIAGIGTQISLEERLRAERGVNEYQHYFAEQLELRRTEPRDDLLTNLLNARIEDDDPDVADQRPLDMAEMLSIVQQLLVAGNETTTKLLTETVRLLSEHPDHWRRLKKDPALAGPVIEEALRLSTPTQGMFRIAAEAHDLDGVAIPEGARIVAVFASANRDETVFPDPDTFDPSRENLRDHLAFGKGMHFCLGAALSRLEGKVTLEEFAKRIDDFTIDEDSQHVYFPSFLLRGLTRLDVSVTKQETPS